MLANLVDTGQSAVIGELRWEDGTLYLPVAGTLGRMNVDGGEYTVGLRWTSSGYRTVSRE